MSGAGNILARIVAPPTQKTLGFSLFLDRSFVVPAVLLATVVTLSQRILARRRLELTSEAMARLTTDVAGASEIKRDVFVHALASAFGRTSRPRAVVVDAFDRLDAITKDVLVSYLKQASPDHSFEVWILFEAFPTATFAKVLETAKPTERMVQRFFMYRLLPLGPDERRRLAERHGHPERWDLTTVAAIARGANGHVDSLDQFFSEYRKRTPAGDSYGCLEFFYLLSLTAARGGRVTLSEPLIVTGLSKTQVVRSDVLGAFLTGTQFRSSEFREMFRAVPDQFGRWLEQDSLDRAGGLLVSPEVGQYLADNWARFNLPPPNLGHLFWALFWHDTFREGARQPFEVRKVSTHIIECRSSVRMLLDGSKVAQSLFEAVLGTARESLSACMPEYVPRLLESAEGLVDLCGPRGSRGRLSRLIALCWQSFAVLGDDDILRVVLSAESRRPHPSHGEDPDSIDHLFCEVIASGTGTLYASLAPSSASPGRPLEATRAYGRFRVAWLLLTLDHFLDDLFPRLEQLVKDSLGQLSPLMTLASNAVGEGSAPQLAPDLLAFSLGLWTMTLAVVEGRTVPDVEGVDPEAREAGSNVPPSEQAPGESMQPWSAGLRALVGHLEQAVLLPEELSLPGPGLAHYDFVLEGLRKELAILAGLCAILLASQPETRDELEPGPLAGIVTLAMESFRTRVAPITTWGDLQGGALHEALLAQANLMQATWARLGIPHLSRLLALRRAQWQVLSTPKSERHTVVADVAGSLASEGALAGAVGLLAHSVGAHAASASDEMAAALLLNGLHMALRAETGEPLRGELCLLAIDVSAMFEADLDVFLGELLEPSSVSPEVPRVAQLLEEPSEESQMRAFRILLNAAIRCTVEGVPEAILAVLRRRAARIQDAECQIQASAMLELFMLELAALRGQLSDAETIINRWGSLPRDHSFAWLLRLLMSHAHKGRRRVEREALDLLNAMMDTQPNGSGYIQLAISAVEAVSVAGSGDHDLSQELIRVAVAFIVQNYETWEPRFSVEANLEALQILIVHAEAHQSFYRNKQLKWEVIRHERDEVKKMPSLVAQGAFFLLLEHYFRALTFWGVETDIPNTALAEAWGVAPTELLRRVSIWQADGGQVPDAFIEKGGKPCLSSSFLILGRYLWTPPLNADPQYDDARSSFNRIARSRISKLLEGLGSATEVPESIRVILRRHRERFMQSTKWE